MIAKYEDTPKTLQQSKQKFCLRKRGTSRILKVPYRSQGDDKADKLAPAATGPSKRFQKYVDGLQGLYWPMQAVEKVSHEAVNAAKKGLAKDLT